MFLQNLWAKHQAKSAANGVRESMKSMGSTEGDKSKIEREKARNEAAAELEKKKSDRAERKAKLTEQMAKHRSGST